MSCLRRLGDSSLYLSLSDGNDFPFPGGLLNTHYFLTRSSERAQCDNSRQASPPSLHGNGAWSTMAVGMALQRRGRTADVAWSERWPLSFPVRFYFEWLDRRRFSHSAISDLKTLHSSFLRMQNGVDISHVNHVSSVSSLGQQY